MKNPNLSLWRETTPPNTSLPLQHDLNVDVCIIGAGIAGMTCAYFLTQSRKKVAVVDVGPLGWGATADTTAHITWVLDDRYHELSSKIGEEKAKQVALSHRDAIQTIEKIATDEKIDCNLEHVSGYLFTTPDSSKDPFEKELEVLRHMGFNEVHHLSKAPIPDFATGPCIHYPHQLQFHPLRYINGLCRTILSAGGQVIPNTRIVDVQEKNGIAAITENGSIISAQHLIVATNSPINNWVTMHTKQAAYQTYVVALRIPRYSHNYALYWDDLEPYHYVRFASAADYDLIIVGGEDHKTGQEDDSEERFNRLEEWTRARFSQAGEVEYKWCGQILEPVDRLAYIGHNPGDNKNVYIASGFSGNGMTYGTISGKLLNDLILGRSNDLEKVYDPSRIPLHSAGEYAKENLNTAWQYKDWIKPGEVASENEIAPGEGAILRKGLKVLAVYKDDAGSCHAYSAKCTHLGCVVHWNHAAKTWDCPCHGSRFNPKGDVINGPAIKALEPEPINKEDEGASVADASNSNLPTEHR